MLFKKTCLLLCKATILSALFTLQTKTTQGFFLSTHHRLFHQKRYYSLFAFMAEKEFQAPDHVLIAGAGIIGISTAYYLQKNHNVQSITLIDRTGSIAPAASGKAGGFLTLDWNDHSDTGQLTRRSFALHQELADDLDPSTIQYRRLTCAAVRVNPYNTPNGSALRRPRGKKLEGVEWAVPANVEQSAVLGMQPLGDASTIAQVHPKRLCERMWERVCQNVPNAKIIKGVVKGAVHSQEGGHFVGASVVTDDREDAVIIIEGNALLFACGPWTADIVKGVKYHSVVVPTESVVTQCVFFSGCGDPEVYVRPDSTAYCTGFPEPERVVVEEPGQEQIQPEKIATILESVRDACGHRNDANNHGNNNNNNNNNNNATDRGNSSWALDTTKPIVEQACYLPTTDDNIPLIGKLPKAVSGGDCCYIATGHGCWGILLGPATGESMSNLIMTGKSTNVNLAPFDPKRVGAFKLVPS